MQAYETEFQLMKAYTVECPDVSDSVFIAQKLPHLLSVTYNEPLQHYERATSDDVTSNYDVLHSLMLTCNWFHDTSLPELHGQV